MNKYILTLTALLTFGIAWADEPKKADAPQPAPKKDTGVVTPEKLGEMLRDLAYEPKDISVNNKKDNYEITTETNNWKLYISVSVSGDLTTLWLDVHFAPLTELDEAPTAALMKLLELSHDNDPIHFSLDEKKRIHVVMPRDNYGITPVVLRKEIEKFDATVRQTSQFWRSSNFKALPKLEPLTDAGRKVLEQLAGTWVVVEEQVNGKKTDEAAVKEAVITYVFAGDKARAKSKTTPEVEATLWSNGGAAPMALDMAFMSNRTVQKAIVKLEGDTLTLCIANPDKPRPTEFTAPAGFKGQLIVLKKQKP